MRHVLTRLRQMAPREIAERGIMAARQQADRLAWRARRPQWNRAQLASALARSSPVADAARLVGRGDGRAAHRLLVTHFATRPQRFVVTPTLRDSLARQIRARFPNAAADAARRADRAADGRFDLLGYRGLSFARGPRQPIDWWWDPVHDRRAPEVHWSEVRYLDSGIGDHKIIWELNRHQHWLSLGRAWWLTGDRRYRGAFIEQLQGWMAANPPRTGINWASMLELGFRTLSWIWALHLFAERPAVDSDPAAAGEPPWTVDLLLGLDAQLRLVERHLSTYFSPNTHLLGEALALYVAGRVLPELRAADRWARIGRRVLLEEARRQIHRDGGHVELSTHYHRYTLDFYLLALAIARTTGDRHATVAFAGVVRALAGYARTLSDRHYHLPQLGDDDGGMLFPMCGGDPRDAGSSLALAAALLDDPDLGDGRGHEELAWMAGQVAAAGRGAPRASACLRDSGYVVSRTSRGDHLVMDVGPLGYLNAGHAHADALSLTLNVAGRPLLIDPGTGAYTIDRALRDRLRSTAAHNTVTIDDRWQSEPAGPFHWSSRASVRLDECVLAPDGDFIEASHDGYGDSLHRRQVLARPGCWIIVDWVTGPAPQTVAAHWHLDPAWRVRSQGGPVTLQHASGLLVWMLTSHEPVEVHTAGDALGWHAPAYGLLQPTTTLRVAVDATPPYALVTAFVESADAPSFDWLTPVAARGQSPDPLAFRLVTAGWHDTVVSAGPSNATVDGAGFGIRGRGRLLCARSGTTAAAPASLAAAAG